MYMVYDTYIRINYNIYMFVFACIHMYVCVYVVYGRVVYGPI